MKKKMKTDGDSKTSSNEHNYECELCKDTEWIINKETDTAKPCNCRPVKRYKKLLENSGIAEAFLEKTFENFITKNKDLKLMYDTAKNYVDNFDEVTLTKNNGLALLGQVGSGKTHLTIAVANKLMARNIGVKYMQYREDIPRIKQVVTSEIDYNREISKYKTAPVLLIDDLYKSSIGKGQYGEYLNDADKRVVFEIVNYRYFKGLPIIISSECSATQLIDLDEGIGSRLIEMCKTHIVEIKGKDNNYRLRG
jgi:DNA replication protein DnaC